MNVLLDGPNFHEEWAYDRFKHFINMNSRVTVIPFAFHDDWIVDLDQWFECYRRSSGKFYKGIVEPFLQYGVVEDNIRFINYFKDTAESLEEILSETDIVYFIGGLPDNTIRRLDELSMTNVLNRYEGIILGFSAGASMQVEKYYIAPDKDYKEFSWQVGLTHIDEFAVQVHYHASENQLISISKFIDVTGRKVYTLESNSAIIVDDKKLELIGNAKEFRL